MATSKQPAMEWTDEHDILLREMIASELFQFKKDSPDRGKLLFAAVLRIAANYCFHGSSLLTAVTDTHV